MCVATLLRVALAKTTTDIKPIVLGVLILGANLTNISQMS